MVVLQKFCDSNEQLSSWQFWNLITDKGSYYLHKVLHWKELLYLDLRQNSFIALTPVMKLFLVYFGPYSLFLRTALTKPETKKYVSMNTEGTTGKWILVEFHRHLLCFPDVYIGWHCRKRNVPQYRKLGWIINLVFTFMAHL